MSAAFDRRSIPAGASESSWTTSDGHCIRRIDWIASQPKGSILFLSGRADFYEKYLEAMAHWHDRNWTVTAFDWRGQGGSGRLGDDAFTGHVEDFGLWVADLRQFWGEWTRQRPGPKFVIGHSMGGHLALRAVAEGAIDPARFISILHYDGAPITARFITKEISERLKAFGKPARTKVAS